jgi:hypothetical protein
MTAKVKVCKFKSFGDGETVVAPRMATRDFIAKADGEIIEATELEVDMALVDDNGQVPVHIRPT